jgi:hypothetical protein
MNIGPYTRCNLEHIYTTTNSCPENIHHRIFATTPALLYNTCSHKYIHHARPDIDPTHALRQGLRRPPRLLGRPGVDLHRPTLGTRGHLASSLRRVEERQEDRQETGLHAGHCGPQHSVSRCVEKVGDSGCGADVFATWSFVFFSCSVSYR